MPVCPPKPVRSLLLAAVVLLASGRLLASVPALAQRLSPIPPPAGEQPVALCSGWKPTFQTTPLANGRAQPYLLVPLDHEDFRGCGVSPVLFGGLPVVRLSVSTSSGQWRELNLAAEIHGLPYPAPPTARIFWKQPAGDFPRGTRMAVYLLVNTVPPAAAGAPGRTEWLRYEMPGAIPTINPSSTGPVEVTGSANYVPNELLLNGATRPAYHGSLRIVLPSLSSNEQGDQIFLRSDNLISSQNLDDAAGYTLAFGVQRNYPRPDRDIAPNDSVEIWARTNQATTDQAVGVSAGSLFLGHDWRGPKASRFLYAALTPRLQILPLQFADLTRRDTRLDPGFTERSYYDPSAELILSPFFVGLRRGHTATLVRNANLSLDLKGWYVTGLGPEYRYVVRLQLPVRIWILQDIGISYFQGADENSYFRYSNGIGFDASVRHF